MCNFSYIPVGDYLTIDVSYGFCAGCSNELPTGFHQVKYVGHKSYDGRVYDQFDVLDKQYCAKCGGEMKFYLQLCEDFDSFADLEVQEEQEEEQYKPNFVQQDIDWTKYLAPAVPKIDDDLFRRYNDLQRAS